MTKSTATHDSIKAACKSLLRTFKAQTGGNLDDKNNIRITAEGVEALHQGVLAILDDAQAIGLLRKSDMRKEKKWIGDDVKVVNRGNKPIRLYAQNSPKPQMQIHGGDAIRKHFSDAVQYVFNALDQDMRNHLTLRNTVKSWVVDERNLHLKR